MTLPRTYDADFYPILASETPLIVSINRIPHHFPPHRHEVLEFSLVVEGEGIEKINGVSHSMAPGTVTLIMPYQIHEIRNTGSEPLVLFNCMFGIDLVLTSFSNRNEQLADALMSYRSPEPYSFRLRDSARTKMEGLFRDLLREFIHDAPFRTNMLTAKLTELLIFLIRNAPSSLAPSLRSENRLPERQHLPGQILLYLHTHYREKLTLDEVASRFFVSRAHLCALLRETTGKTFTELIHEIRLRHACSLLTATDMKISDVATESGFASSQTFFRVFRQAKKMSPNEYRNRRDHR